MSIYNHEKYCKIIISNLKPVFLYRGLGLFDKSSSMTCSPLRRVLMVTIQSFFLSSTSTSSQIFFCATKFSLRTLAFQPVLRSTCPNHLILLVQSTTSRSLYPSIERRESELTSSFVCLDIADPTVHCTVFSPHAVKSSRCPSLCINQFENFFFANCF